MSTRLKKEFYVKEWDLAECFGWKQWIDPIEFIEHLTTRTVFQCEEI